MKIRKSTEQDFFRIMEIYAFAREYMKTHGNPNQWGPINWPPEELIHNDSDTYGVVHRVAGDGSEKGIGFVCKYPCKKGVLILADFL